MGNAEMKNLNQENIRADDGCVDVQFLQALESNNKIKLPRLYINFIIKHNGADLVRSIFDYYDPNKNMKNSDSLHFSYIEDIQCDIDNIKSGEESDWDIKYKFEDGLIPFGENGGGDMICFDYRKDKTTDNPPVVIWNHDMGFDHRVVFIANNFEEFIDMLHAYEEEE